jgi:DNA-binding FrmR family transcriptional regulator
MISEKSAISVSMVVLLIGIAMFIARLHSQNEQQQAEIQELKQIITERAIRQEDRLNDLDRRLSRIEGQLQKIEKWCQELILQKRANRP